MLPSLSGPVHLAVGGGCGGTTFALQYARSALSEGMHVAWICDEFPDSDRFSQMFEEVSPIAVSKLHLIAVGENTAKGIQSAISLLNVLSNISLIVVDDWTPKSGRVNSNIQTEMITLMESCVECEVDFLAISSAYEDAAGGGWKSRGKLGDTPVWFLHRDEIDSMMRELHLPEQVLKLEIGDSGFTPRK